MKSGLTIANVIDECEEDSTLHVRFWFFSIKQVRGSREDTDLSPRCRVCLGNECFVYPIPFTKLVTKSSMAGELPWQIVFNLWQIVIGDLRK
jgi:hypothetical protein